MLGGDQDPGQGADEGAVPWPSGTPGLEEPWAAFGASMDGVAILDARERYVFLNDAHARVYGYDSPTELVGRSWHELYSPDERARIEREAMSALRRDGRWRGEALGRRRDGSHFDQELSLSVLPKGGLVCVVRDVSERKRAERLQSVLFRVAALSFDSGCMEDLYRRVHELIGELIDARNFYVATQDAESGALSFPYFVDQVEPQPPSAAFERGLTAYVLRTGRPLLADPETFDALLRAGEVELVGSPSVDWLGVPLLHGESRLGALVVQSYDPAVRFSRGDLELLTFVGRHVAAAIQRRRAAEALAESEARFRTLADTAPCAIFIFQGERFVYANDACLQITGRSRDEFLALSFWELVAPEFRELVRERGRRRQDLASVPKRYELRLERPDGGERWLDYSAGVIEYAGRSAVLGVAFDVTQRRLAEAEVRRLAYHDALTGLPNRLLCQDRLTMAVAQAHRQGQRLALLFLDLDRFKAVNDSLGHASGDQLLRVVADRLRACVREGDTVARLGGDEFVLLLPGVQRAVDAVRVAGKVLETLRQPVQLGEHELRISASVGIGLYPDDAADAGTLLRNADTAMYRAKQGGRDICQLYAPAMNAAATERLAFERDLRQAALNESLELHFQPVLDLTSGRVVEVEAMLRWRRPGGYVSTAEFLPVAELVGLTQALAPRVLHEACARARGWEALVPGLGVSVNLSARQLQQPELVSHVAEALAQTGLEPRRLGLEFTEAVLAQAGENGPETLRRLRALGVRTVLDDFGGGSSAFLTWQRLPLDTVKLDLAALHGAGLGTARADAVAAALISLVRALGLELVVEGVETEEQLAFVTRQGCGRVQGFVFSRALPPHELERLLQERDPIRR